MAECIVCGAYTKFNSGYCNKCYSDKNKHENNLEVTEYEDAGGLTDKERAYRYGMIKGRIAETLIQELFLSLGYNIGWEGINSGIKKLPW